MIYTGSNRSRIFADGKPNAPSIKWTEVRSITPIMNGAGIVSSSPMPTDTAGDVSDSFVSIVNSRSTNIDANERELMPERLSPDGADEGEELQLSNEQAEFDDDDAWSDWETEQQSNELPHTEQTEQSIRDTNENKDENVTVLPNYSKSISISSSTNSTAPNQNNDTLIKDIKDIDIKPLNNQLNDKIDDFFKDMEPIIAKQNSNVPILEANFNNDTTNENPSSRDAKEKTQNEIKIDENRFAVTVNIDDDTFDDTAWGNEASDWEN